MNSKTKHLDTALSILKGNPAAKKAKRRAQVELEVWSSDGTYTVAANGKTVESGEGDAAYAKDRADIRASAIRALGKTVIILIY